MTWNYRLVKTAEGVSVFEVFYDELGQPIGLTAQPTLNFFCETVEDILAELEIIKAGFKLPVLDESVIGKS